MWWLLGIAAHTVVFAEDTVHASTGDQIYYFQQVGQLVAGSAPYLEVVSSTANSPCDIVVTCGDTEHRVPRTGPRKTDPGTQSVHFTLAEVKCDRRTVVAGSCENPWAVALNSPRGSLSARGAARIQGSWWSKQYSLGWLQALAIIAVAHRRGGLHHAAAGAAVATSLSKVHHTLAFAGTPAAAVVAAAQLAMVPVALAAPNRPVAATLAAAILAAVGVGGVLPNLLAIAAAIWH